MTPEHARDLVEQTLLFIVPDADLAGMPNDADLREYLELDSLDFLVLVERLSQGAEYQIDEADYDEIGTMNSAVDFLAAHASA